MRPRWGIPHSTLPLPGAWPSLLPRPRPRRRGAAARCGCWAATAFIRMVFMSPLEANWLNRSTDSNARCPLRSPGWITSMETYWSLSGSSPSSSGSTSSVMGPWYWGCSCTISLANSSSPAWRPDRSDTRTCLTATAGLLGRTRAKHRRQRRREAWKRRARQSHATIQGGDTQHDESLMKPDSQRLTTSGSVMSTTVRVLRDPSQVASIVILEHRHASQRLRSVGELSGCGLLVGCRQRGQQLLRHLSNRAALADAQIPDRRLDGGQRPQRPTLKHRARQLQIRRPGVLVHGHQARPIRQARHEGDNAGLALMGGEPGKPTRLERHRPLRQAPQKALLTWRCGGDDRLEVVGSSNRIPALARGSQGRPRAQDRLNRRQQLLATRHDRALDQDRDHPDVALQRRRDLQADEVVGVIQPPPPVLVGGAEPARADHRQQHLTATHRLGDDLGEVNPQRDRVDIHEDLVVAEAGREPVVQAAGQAAGLLPPVADEHPARAGSRHRRQTPSLADGSILSGRRAQIDTSDTSALPGQARQVSGRRGLLGRVFGPCPARAVPPWPTPSPRATGSWSPAGYGSAAGRPPRATSGQSPRSRPMRSAPP